MLFAKEPIIQLISLYLAFIYGVIYSKLYLLHHYCIFTHSRYTTVVITIIPPIYTNIYHESPGHVGLHYIALGLGTCYPTDVAGAWQSLTG